MLLSSCVTGFTFAVEKDVICPIFHGIEQDRFADQEITEIMFGANLDRNTAWNDGDIRDCPVTPPDLTKKDTPDEDDSK